MKLKFLPVILLLIFPFSSFAQKYTIKGVITDENGKPAPNTKVALPGSNNSTTTNESGEFILNDVPAGTTKLDVSPVEKVKSDAIENPMQVAVDTAKEDEIVNTHADTENIPTISSDDEGAQSQASTSENVASVLNSSRDAFTNAASYNFSVARFRVRGYDDENLVMLMNGVPMNDLTTGRGLYNSWSGLNDVVRNREITSGLAPAYYSFGDVGGTVSIDSRASHQRKQLQASFSIANRTYDNRFMITYGSGLSKNGWAYSVSYSRRWAQEGYVKGTYYDGHSYFLSVEKYINSRHSISFTAMGAPTENGRGKSSYQEMYDLADNNYYNPNWGYQNGKIRNSAVGKNHQPLVTLTYHWDIDSKSSLNAAVGYSFGYNRVSSIDWFNALNPQPDYYRNLPSFDPNYNEDQLSFIPYAQELAAMLRNNTDSRQLNWDALYEANALHDTVYGGVSGRMAKYVLQEYVTNFSRFSFNAYYNNVLNDHTKLTLGYSYQQQTSEYYKELTDLLGADFYVDLNQFVDVENPTENDVAQNDLNNPDRVLHVGDKYGYHYKANIRKYSLWGQAQFNFDHFDYMVAVNINSTDMYRDGETKNGIFPNDSYGKSHVFTYPDAGVKGGAVYKMNGRNYFFANAAFETRAPYFDNLFLSPKTNNRVGKADDEFITSFEGGYQLKAPRVKGKLTGFYTQYTDETETIHFYNESFHTFTNYTLTGLNKRHEGIEAALEVNLGRGFAANGVVSAGQYFYSSRPTARITQDSKDSVLATDELIYLKNVRLSNGPQQAYSLGLNYRSSKFWYLYMSVNAFDGIYYDASFTRRQIESLDLVDAGSAKWNEILQQKQSFNGYTLDISGGWSWKIDNQFKSIKRPVYLVLNIGVNNVTDNQDIITRAAEPLRFDFADKNVNKFAPRVTYAFGRTYFINLTLRMN
ncbi:MAG: TonB-dependent receptor [Bacteroidota bacterium]